MEQIEAEILRRAREVKDINRQLKTTSKKAEEALKASEQRFRSIFNQSAVGIAQTNLEGKFLLVNDQYSTMVARDKNELYGLSIQDIIHPFDIADASITERAISEGKNFILEKRYLRPDMSEVWTMNNVSLIRDDMDNPQFVVVVSQDITERKRIEREMMQLKEELEQRFISRTDELQVLNSKLDDFKHTVTHELRVPLRVHDGICQALLKINTARSEKEKEYLHQLQASSQKMVQLMDDLLKHLPT
jgi:PAS domain S-box-containing protein